MREILSTGADLVVCSGHKYLCGPTSGIVSGREELVRAVRLQEVAVARPLTHDLLRSVVDALGAQVSCIVVNDLSNDTFYARIMLEVDGRALEIDSRPSDAIALAVRAQVPIYAEEAVLDKAGVFLDKEGEAAAQEGGEAEPRGKVAPEELEKMSAFREFIESMDLSDFDKRKS